MAHNITQTHRQVYAHGGNVTQPVFAYQKLGACFLASRNRALLCDEMGLGKTAQAIIASDAVKASNVLVLAPAALGENWRREFLRWQSTERPTRVLQSGDRHFDPGVHIASYDLARQKPVLNALLARSWDVLIVDEAHFCKEPTAQRTQTILGPRCDGEHGLVSRATYAWGLTGTPMPNDPSELWTLFCAFGPEALWDAAAGAPLSYGKWKQRYCVTVYDEKRGERVMGVRNTEELRARMAPVLLRRKKADVLKDLPPLREGEIALSARKHLADIEAATDPEIAALVKRIVATLLLSDDVDKDVQHILQSASDDSMSRLRRVTASVKARALAPLLVEEMRGGGEKLVVMGWHRDTLDVMHEALAPFGVARLDGQTQPSQRQAVVDSFQTDPGCRVFLGQIQAAGTGITLTAASNLVFAEMAWTLSDNTQAAMRVHRVGQTKPVLIRYATLAGTIDEAVIRTLRRKTQMIRNVLN